jgi:hypothetical protein
MLQGQTQLAISYKGTVIASDTEVERPLKMESEVNGVRVQFYLDLAAESHIFNKETFD